MSPSRFTYQTNATNKFIVSSHFTSRAAADIKGLGYATMSELHKEGLVHTPADIYTLQARVSSEVSPSLNGLKGWGEKSIQNLFQSIESRQTLSFERC